MIFVPSCDDKKDAVRSLLEIYSVSAEKIFHALNNPVVLEIAESKAELESEFSPAVVGQILGAWPRREITAAAY